MARAHVGTRSTEAYVVRTYDFGEADRVVVLVSPELGRLEGVAKRAKSLKAALGAALEPLTWVRATFRERPGRDLVSLQKVELLRSSFGRLSTRASLETFSHVAELAQAVARPGEGSQLLVRLIRGVLEAKADPDRVAERGGAPAPLDLLRVYFDLWVARLEGFWPALDSCTHCNVELLGTRRVGVHTLGALCAGCATGNREATLGISAGAAALALRLQALGPAEAVRIETSRRCLDEIGQLAEALLGAHLERDLRTMSRKARALPRT